MKKLRHCHPMYVTRYQKTPTSHVSKQMENRAPGCTYYTDGTRLKLTLIDGITAVLLQPGYNDRPCSSQAEFWLPIDQTQTNQQLCFAPTVVYRRSLSA